jgi:hypothetical protein
MSSKHYRKEKDCLNCGHLVEDRFCSHCGQENIEIKEPFWTFVSHGVGHYFHYDSKFKRTLRPFLTKPGQLTKDHIAGKRASHIPPISLYLFITLVYFLFAPIFKEERKKNTDNYNYSYNYQSGTSRQVTKDGNGDVVDPIDTLYIKFSKLPYSVQIAEISKLENELKSAELDSVTRESKEDLLDDYKDIHIEKGDSTVAAYRQRQATLSEGQKDDAIDRFFTEKMINYRNKTGQEFKSSEMIDKYFPKLLFILMPLFAFFLMLNFRKNKKLYMEHLIFTLHLFSFAYLNFFVSELLQYLIPNTFTDEMIGLVSSCILIWYIYRSIRVFYERKRWVTVRKLFSLTFLFGIAFMITIGFAFSVFMLFQ